MNAPVQFAGQTDLQDMGFFRPVPLSLAGFSGSGADWLERYNPFIEVGTTVVAGPDNGWGPAEQ
jgi:hypothetical protein